MTTLRHIFITLTAVVALAAMGQSVYVQSTVTLVDAGGYFPQLSPDGTKLVYAPTDAVNLKILEMDSTGNRTTTIASKGYPGFDARFGPDGKVYYVTQERVRGNLIHRTGHCYDPATGQTTTVLPAQHGAVQAIPAGDGLVMLGERDRKVIGRVNKPFAYARGPRLYVVMPDGRERMTSPAGECPMYLWPSVSPSGRKVVFEAVGKGLYVTDLSGKVLARLGKFLMPSTTTTWWPCAAATTPTTAVIISTLSRPTDRACAPSPTATAPSSPRCRATRWCTPPIRERFAL